MTKPDSKPAKTIDMDRLLILVLNGKGGVGKSFFAINFVQWLKDLDVAHLAFDTDNENSTLKRFHPETGFASLEDKQELDAMFTSLDQEELMLVDCRAASTDILLEYFEEIDLQQVLDQLKARLLIVCPVNHESDSIEQIRVIVESLQNTCQYLIVRNQSHSSEFRIYDESSIRTTLLESLGAREMHMPKLYDWLVTELQGLNVPASIAAKREKVSLMNRQRLRNWSAAFGAELEEHRALLLPSTHQDP